MPQKVLIADPYNSELYEAALNGHSITRVSTSEQALETLAREALAKESFDVLIVNERLPGQMRSGCDLIAMAGPLVKVIIMTTTEDCKDKAEKAGATAFFAVPVPIRKLREMVNRASEFHKR